MRPSAPSKQTSIPTLPAYTVCTVRSVEEYATLVHANSTKTAFIDPRGWLDLHLKAFTDILLPVNTSTPGFFTPRHDETERSL
jgi:hypothetical protein